MRQARFLVGMLGCILLLGSGVRAEDVPTPGPAGPCAADIQRFCKDTVKGEGRLRACLMQHAAELATECRVRLEAKPGAPGTKPTPAMGPQHLTACRSDLRTHCAGVPSGGGRLRACLESHTDKLSPRCKGALARPAGTPP